MLKYLVAYGTFLIVMLVMDLSWLGFFAKDFYKSALGDLLLDKPHMGAAAIFYVLYVLGAVVFVVSPGIAAGSWSRTLAFGAMYGFFVYMTYDLTNLAMIRGWPQSVVAIDIAWGVVLTGVASTAAYLAASRL